MKLRTRFLLVILLTAVAQIGCASDPLSPREGAIRERLWSESVLVRGASPDDRVATLVTNSTNDTASLASADPTVNHRCEPCRPVYAPYPPLNCWDDWNNLVPEFCHDVECVLNHKNLCVLLAAGGVSYLVHETLDDDVAEAYERNPNRWGKAQDVIGGFGNPAHHFAAIGGLYMYSLHAQDPELHDLSKALFNAVSITGLTTVALKATIGTNTEAPSGEPDPFGGAWPSGHTSSSFAFAAVLDEYYGPMVGIPAYILAGLVGWERIDDGEHDLSDVVFGAVLGYVIGKTVAVEHHVRFCGMEMQPFVDGATGSTGLCLERRF
jgi:hypothetical protein